MATTTKWGLPVPDQLPAGTGPDIPKDVKALGDAVDAKLTPYSQGLLDDRPAYGKVGQRYRDENGQEWLDIGSAWVLSGGMADGSVTTAKLADLSVTTGKLADDAVTTGKIAAGAVGSTDLADKAVTAVKVADALKPSTGAAAGDEALRALGTTAGTAAAGNDARLSNARTPTAHAASHGPGGSDAMWGSGTIAARPSADGKPVGFMYYATDDWGGTLYQGDGVGTGTGAAGTGWTLISSKNQKILTFAGDVTKTITGLAASDEFYTFDFNLSSSDGSSIWFRFNGDATASAYSGGYLYGGGAPTWAAWGPQNAGVFSAGWANNIWQLGRGTISARRNSAGAWKIGYQSAISTYDTRTMIVTGIWNGNADLSTLVVTAVTGTLTGHFVLRRGFIPS